MAKKILVVYYTQTGQLEDILNNFIAPFSNAGMIVEKLRVRPVKEYGFPWSADSFFNEMPDSVSGVRTPLQPILPKETTYDLVIFGWQPWFLSPSIPTNSIMQHPAFRAVIKNTPVITITGARNMWLNAITRLKKDIKEAGANWVGNVVLTDRNQNFVSGVTILYWMLWGKKDRLWKIFPFPGVSAKDIDNAGEYGKTVIPFLQKGDWKHLQPALIQQKAIDVKWDLMFIEARAGKLFSLWANLINKKKNKAPWLVLFRYYLLIALFVVAPVVVGTYGLLFKPFLGKSINKKRQYFMELN